MGSAIVLVSLYILIGAVASFDVSRLNIEEFIPPLVPYQDTIVGGHAVNIKQYPHQVSIHIKMYLCGGFIISQNDILTAAHCFVGMNVSPERIKVKAGSASVAAGTLIPLTEVIVHPNYNRRTLDNDIAVFKTAQPIQFSQSVKAVKLPSKDRPMNVGTMITVAGWGAMKEDGHGSHQLLAVDIPVSDFQKCKLKNQEFGFQVTQNMFCAGYAEGGKDSCQGDSGGAALQGNMAVGIVSFGMGCARPMVPGIYTNLAAPSVRDFITKHTGL